MKKVTIKSAEGKTDGDKVKRVYRAALDTIKKLDDFSKAQKPFRDMFLPESVGLRNRLKDYCERLMFYDPLEYGRKAEELLWRKVFYDIIQKMKQNRRYQRPSKSLETAFRTHLSAATGYYHHLLLRLQIEFSSPLEGVVDFHTLPEPKSHKKQQAQVAPKDLDKETRTQHWVKKACHRCLVCLGDIARYQHDYDGYRSLLASRRYYYQAIALQPDRGMSHNQLGTLAGSRFYNVEAAYHYLRCMLCVTSFEGAQGNLNRLFEKNRKRFLEVSATTPRDAHPDIQQSKDVKRFLVRFLKLLDIFYNSESIDSKDLQELCQNTLQDFDLCMLYTKGAPVTQSVRYPAEERPSYLDNEITFKIVVMLMITIHKLQQSGSKEVTAAIAFHLAMFSHILSHTATRLQSALYELENPRQHLDPGSTESTDTEEDSTANPANSLEQGKDAVVKVKTKKYRLKKLRRRHHCDGNDLEDLSESDLSEGEEDEHMDLGSDSDEELAYLAKNSDSGSDSDTDLMESQELRPGFFNNATPDELEQGLERLDLQNMQRSFTAGTNESLLDGSLNGPGLVNGFGFSNQNTEFVLDTNMDNYLKDFSSQLFSSSNTLMGGLGSFLPRVNPPDNVDDVCTDVIQGKTNVRVPPGFDGDPEAQHVAEITEKISSFNIDTDTDTSVMPDTEAAMVEW